MDGAETHDGGETLGEAGELAALARILPLLPQGDATVLGPGDDAAVVAAPDGRFVVTTDTMLEGADFRLAWSTWHDLGVKAVATNLIDVAAMGARPTSLVVAIAVSPATRVADLEDFARGLAAGVAAMAPGCGVVGGDLGSGPVATIAVTAFGDLEGREPVLRSGARPGDAVWVVGALGLAAEGLRALFAATESPERDERLEAQLAPVTPVAAGTALAELGASAMLDVSDGLALDASRIARASGVVIALESALVEAAAVGPGGEGAWLDAALHGGEDHALLVTLPEGVEPPETIGGHAVRRIGVVEPAGASGPSPSGPGVTLDGEPLAARGWDPYRA